MKNKFLIAALLALTSMSMCAQTGSRILVTYFSWGNNTKALAEEIQRQTGADIYRIEPLVPYPDDYQTLAYDIAYNEKEQNARPALKDTDADISGHDIIFVGCPVWWFDAPMIIHSFLECPEYDFSGKTIVPFCTYATAAYQTLDDIVNATPDSQHLEGLGLPGSHSYTSQTVKNWLDRIGVSDIAGIDYVPANQNGAQAVYSLNGVRIADPTHVQKGIYVVNGRKVVFK